MRKGNRKVNIFKIDLDDIVNNSSNNSFLDIIFSSWDKQEVNEDSFTFSKKIDDLKKMNRKNKKQKIKLLKHKQKQENLKFSPDIFLSDDIKVINILIFLIIFLNNQFFTLAFKKIQNN